MTNASAPMTPERLAEIRDRTARDYATHESGIYLSNELVVDRLLLLAEVDSLSSELRLADAHLRDSDATLADYKAQVDRLRAQVAHLWGYAEAVEQNRSAEVWDRDCFVSDFREWRAASGDEAQP